MDKSIFEILKLLNGFGNQNPFSQMFNNQQNGFSQNEQPQQNFYQNNFSNPRSYNPNQNSAQNNARGYYPNEAYDNINQNYQPNSNFDHQNYQSNNNFNNQNFAQNSFSSNPFANIFSQTQDGNMLHFLMSMMGNGSNPLAEIFSQSKQNQTSSKMSSEENEIKSEVVSPNEEILL